MRSNNAFSSILTFILCLCLIVGVSFALLTSKDETNISINSGKVEVLAEVTDLALYSQENIDVNTKVGTHIDVVGYTFPNGGTADYTDGTLTLDRLTPGDGVTFNISVTNNSNVAIKYRTVISDITGSSFLMDALEVSINGADYYGAVTGEWTSLEAEGAIASIPVSIELPASAGNEYRGLDVAISITVEAIQGNAVENVASINGTPYETFAEAIAVAQSGDIIEVADNAIIQMPANVADGVTIKGATFNTPVNVTAAAATVAEGDEPVEATANPVVFDSCTFKGNALLSVADRDVKLTNCTFIDTATGASAEGDMPYVYQKSGAATVTVENTTADVTIRSAAKWVEMAKALNTLDDQSYLTLKLGANLDFTGVTDFTVKTLATTLDGQGYTISNLAFDCSNNVDSHTKSEPLGLFGTITKTGSVKNLTLANASANLKGYYAIGMIASVMNGKAENCVVNNATIVVDGYLKFSGAMFGKVNGGAVIDGCDVNGLTITITGTDNGSYVGGLIGYAEGTNGNTIEVSNSTVSNVTFDASYKTKVFAGFVAETYFAKFENCTVKNFKFTVDECFVHIGGFVANAAEGSEFVDCDVIGATFDVTTNEASRMGGFAGRTRNTVENTEFPMSFTNCDVSGLSITVHGNIGSHISGFSGNTTGEAPTTMVNCSVEGVIDITDAVIGSKGTVNKVAKSDHANDSIECTENVTIIEK